MPKLTTVISTDASIMVNKKMELIGQNGSYRHTVVTSTSTIESFGQLSDLLSDKPATRVAFTSVAIQSIPKTAWQFLESEVNTSLRFEKNEKLYVKNKNHSVLVSENEGQLNLLGSNVNHAVTSAVIGMQTSRAPTLH
jgi:hypothetical protein